MKKWYYGDVHGFQVSSTERVMSYLQNRIQLTLPELEEKKIVLPTLYNFVSGFRSDIDIYI